MQIELFGWKLTIFSPAQWEKVKLLSAQYFLHPVVLSAFVLLVVCVAAYVAASRRNNPTVKNRLKKTLPPLYLLLIVSLALLNRLPGSGARSVFHLRLDYIFEGTTGIHETRVLMAVFDFLYYIPFGFLLRWAAPNRKGLVPLLFASATGLMMELGQWIFGLGVGTVEHWLLYSIGAATGIVICAVYCAHREKERSGETLSSKRSKALNLVASGVVTALLVLVWHAMVPHIVEFTPPVKLISYLIPLFGMTWILDAALAFYHAPQKKAAAEQALTVQFVYAAVGLIVFALYAATAHAIVAVLFDGGEKSLIFATSSAEKCTLALTGFCILLSRSLRDFPRRLKLGLIYPFIPAVGILLSFAVPDLIVVTTGMAILTVLISGIDLVTTCKRSGVSIASFAVRHGVYLLLLAVVMLFRHFTPIGMANNVTQFIVNGVVNLTLALGIDFIVLLVLKSKKNHNGDQGAPTLIENTENHRKDLATSVK